MSQDVPSSINQSMAEVRQSQSSCCGAAPRTTIHHYIPFETGQESRNVSQEEFAYAVWVRSTPILPPTKSTNRANGIPDTATELRSRFIRQPPNPSSCLCCLYIYYKDLYHL